MKLNILVLENPLANTTGHQGYVEPESRHAAGESVAEQAVRAAISV
jgi:hypothetical protein